MDWRWSDGQWHDGPEPGTLQETEILNGTSPAFVGHPEVFAQYAAQLPTQSAVNQAYLSAYGYVPEPPNAGARFQPSGLENCSPTNTACVARRTAQFGEQLAAWQRSNAQIYIPTAGAPQTPPASGGQPAAANPPAASGQPAAPAPAVTAPPTSSSSTPPVNVNAAFELIKEIPWYIWAGGAALLLWGRR